MAWKFLRFPRKIQYSRPPSHFVNKNTLEEFLTFPRPRVNELVQKTHGYGYFKLCKFPAKSEGCLREEEVKGGRLSLANFNPRDFEERDSFFLKSQLSSKTWGKVGVLQQSLLHSTPQNLAIIYLHLFIRPSHFSSIFMVKY